MILSIPSMVPRADKTHVVRDNETETWRSDYTERKAGIPQVLLVEQQIPGSRILPHFHGIDQFQVFMDGEGKLGRHPVAPISVHYTNAYTGYGPIVAGHHGLAYYVLRPGFDVMGSQYLHVPEARAKLKPGNKRFFLAENIEVKTAAELRGVAAPVVERLIGVDGEHDPDAGVFLDVVTMGPSMQYAGADPQSGGGQVFLVVQGGILHEGQTLGLRGSVAVTCDEAPLTLASGIDGLQMLAFQYPRRSPA